MKKIIYILFILPSIVLAQPKYLKDGEISVKLKDGKTYKFNSSEYAIIKRNKKPRKLKKLREDFDSSKLKLNTLSFYFGAGPQGLAQGANNSVYQKRELLMGLGLSQRVSKEAHLEVIAITNKTVLTGLKYEF